MITDPFAVTSRNGRTSTVAWTVEKKSRLYASTNTATAQSIGRGHMWGLSAPDSGKRPIVVFQDSSGRLKATTRVS